VPSFIDNGEKTGKRVSPTLKRLFIWRLFKWYFGLRVVAPYGKLDAKKQYIIGAHPHGFLPFGTMVNLLSTVSDVDGIALNGVQIRTLAASFCFYIPLYRDLILGGGVIDAARYNAKRALGNGLSIALVPGGATEALYAGTNTLVLRKRTGFIRLALESGASLVPVYSFGETDTYRQLASVFPFVSKVQAKFQRIFGLSLPIVTNLFPRRCQITTVFGKPIPVKKVDSPSDAEVAALLETYIAAVADLFKAHCNEYVADPKLRKLEII
jgi:1-acyl-sn-glycerol-3-phosphate acyltransferase